MSESIPLTCFQCYKYFPNSLALSRHVCIHQQQIRTHTEDNYYSLAPGYNMDLSQLSSLMSQSCLYQTHKPYKCENCSECFSDEAGLLEHIPKHKESKHICPYCGKNCYFATALSQHIRIHLGIKPFQCEICQRPFTLLTTLERHERTHTDEKPYKCLAPGCKKAFSIRSNLLFHSLHHHQKDNPYRCKSCSKEFDDEAGLLEHIPKHKDSKRLYIHICQFCGQSYKLEAYLSDHMNKNHADRLAKQPLSVNLPSDNLSLGRFDDCFWKSSYVHLSSPPTHHIHPHVSEPCHSTRLQHVDPRGSHQLQNEQQGRSLPEPMRSCEPRTNQQEPVQSTPAVRLDGRMMLRLPQPVPQEHQPNGLRRDQEELLPVPEAVLNVLAYGEATYRVETQDRSTVDTNPLLPDFV